MKYCMCIQPCTSSYSQIILNPICPVYVYGKKGIKVHRKIRAYWRHESNASKNKLLIYFEVQWQAYSGRWAIAGPETPRVRKVCMCDQMVVAVIMLKIYSYSVGRKNKIVTFNTITVHIKSLWPSDAIWRHRSGSTLTQVMACCLTAPSHYLNQRWLIISKVHWHSSVGNFAKEISATNH